MAMTCYIKRGGKVWIKIFPDKPVTASQQKHVAGSGKGALEYCSSVKPGRVIFEIRWRSIEETAREASSSLHKLPCKCWCF